jgi:hypothetical protein
LIGGGINHNSNHDRIFNFITTKGTFSYNEMTDEFTGKLQIRSAIAVKRNALLEGIGSQPESHLFRQEKIKDKSNPTYESNSR